MHAMSVNAFLFYLSTFHDKKKIECVFFLSNLLLQYAHKKKQREGKKREGGEFGKCEWMWEIVINIYQ